MVTVNPDSGASTQTGGRMAERGIAYEPEGALREPLLNGRSYVCWGAVIAGSLAAIALILLSSLLGYACGVPAFAGGTYGWGAGAWSVITAAIAFFAGGALVGYFTPSGEQRNGALHGFMAWVLALPLILIFTGAAAGMFHATASGGLLRDTMQPSALSQPTWGSATGAAWGAFISIAIGLIFAAIGGTVGFMGKANAPQVH
mgnify:CR=1 FL=1